MEVAEIQSLVKNIEENGGTTWNEEDLFASYIQHNIGVTTYSTEAIIKQYLLILNKCFRQVNVCPTRETLLYHIQILSKVVSQEIEKEALIGLLCVTFKLFLDDNNITIKNDITLEDVLSYSNEELKKFAQATKVQYVAIKLICLQIYSLVSRLDQRQMECLTLQYDSNSLFFSILTEIYPVSSDIYDKLTVCFIKLSMSIKTVYRLTFLILATHYSILTRKIKSTLVTKLSKDGIKMFEKSKSLVYKFTAPQLFQLCLVCEEKKIDITMLKPLLSLYNKEEPIQKLGLKWDNLNLTINSNLSSALDEMEISDDIVTLVSKYSNKNLLSSRPFVEKITLHIKNIDFNDASNRKVINLLVTFAVDNASKDRRLLSILDTLTVKFKNVNCSLDSISFILQNLKRMSYYTISINDFKRLGNFARLFFHYGKLFLRVDSKQALLFWKQYIHCEKHISSVSALISTTLKRLNYISNEELLNGCLEVAVKIQLNFINQFMDNDIDPFKCDTILKASFEPSMKIIVQCIIRDRTLINCLFEESSTESLVVSLASYIVHMLENSATIQKEMLISGIILKLKEELKDNGLFFYFLSNISLMISFPITFKIATLDFNTDSKVSNIENLVMSHLYMLQTFSTSIDISDIVLKCYYLMTRHLDTNFETFLDYEFNILRIIIEAMNYNKVYKYSVILIETYKEKRGKYLLKEYINFLNSSLVEIYIKLEQFIECKALIILDSQTPIDSFDEMRLALCTLNYHIFAGNLKDQKAFIQNIKSSFETRDDFSIAKQTDKYKAVELLVLHAQFCKIVGVYNKTDHLISVTNLNRSISILQSIFKNFLLSGPKAPSLNINFKNILKMRFSTEMLECYDLIIRQYSNIGFGKEFDHYLHELDIFVKVQPSVNLQYTYNLKLVDFNLFKGSIDQAEIYTNVVKSDKRHLFTDNNLLINIYSLIVQENFLRKSNNIENINIISKQLDNSIFNLLNLSATKSGDYSPLIEQWIGAMKRRYEYLVEGELDNPKFDIIPNVKEIVNFHNCLQKSQQTVKNEVVSFYPLFSEANEGTSASKTFEKWRLCNNDLRNNYRNNHKTSSVEISKYTLDMIINSFVNMLKNDKSVKMNNELTQLLLLNDQFKCLPFRLEKHFSVNLNKQKKFLPELRYSDFQYDVWDSQRINLKNVLPKGWIVVTLDYVLPTNSLIVSKYDSQYDEPIFVNLSLTEKTDPNSFDCITNMIKNVITESDRTTQYDITSKVKTYDQKLEWWSVRKALDKKLGNILDEIDSSWFGGFNSLFQLKEVYPCEVKNIRECVINMVCDFFSGYNFEIHDIAQRLGQIHDGIYGLFLKINVLTSEKVLDLLFFLVNSVTLGANSIARSELLDLSSILKSKLEQINKARVLTDTENKGHIVLIPGSSCTKIPWESIPSLRGKSVTRMPSVVQLQDYLIKYKSLMETGIEPNKGYYVLNPGGDLKRTEENLYPRFKNLDGWHGVVGEPPKEAELLEAFDNSNLYIYAGHGGGEQYIRSKHIKTRESIPPTLLLGCSSGLLKGEGFIHQHGTAYNYINGGCPMLLVNLWDVTDKDIDLFTVNALTNWGFFVDYDSFDPFDLSVNNHTLSECVARARDVCKLKYLNGAAPVMYGIPLMLEST